MSTAPDARKTNKLGSVSTSFWLGLLVLSMIVFGANTGVATWQGSRGCGGGPPPGPQRGVGGPPAAPRRPTPGAVKKPTAPPPK
ncbi:hypothetical protein Q6A26_21700, partial [Xanthomonas euvesicatoria pv. eucalypti]|uniref:hypothetical protein n=1 Tax=Xanthomonas euvesicatoria TaxID=456327 RepID=UPI0026E22357